MRFPGIVLCGRALTVVSLALSAGCEVAAHADRAPERVGSLLGAERFTVGRLSTTTEWRECTAVPSDELVPRFTCAPTPDAGSRQFTRIAEVTRTVQAALRSDTTPALLHADALLDLYWRASAPAGLDRAAANLDRAVAARPHDAMLLNDLAVVHLEIAQRDQQLEPLLRALDAIQRAFARDSTSPAIRYNRALITERAYLIGTARGAWLDYSARDSSSGWGKEAVAHAAQLEPTPLDRWPGLLSDWLTGERAGDGSVLREQAELSPEAAREFCFNTVLRDWAEAVARGEDERGQELLAFARAVQTSLAEIRADGSVSLAIRAIDDASSPTTLRALARGHRAFADGFELYTDYAYDSALHRLEDAEAAFRAVASPMVRWTWFYEAAASVNVGEFARADALFERIVDEATPDEPALIGKAVWALGVSQLRRGNFTRANERYRAAEPFIEKANEPENLAALSYLLTEGLSQAGRLADGWQTAYEGLRLLSPWRRSTYLNNHTTTVAGYARAAGLHHAALALMDEVVDISTTIGRPMLLARALRARARDHIALDDTVRARSDLLQALGYARQVASGAGRLRVEADVATVLGQLEARRDPNAALPMLLGAAASYRTLGAGSQLPPVLYSAARIARMGGQSDSARKWLSSAIEALERQAATAESAEASAARYETIENVFDLMIELELERDSVARGFEFLERGRAAMWPQHREASVAASGIARLQRSLDPDVLIVEYAVLADRLVHWTISRHGWRHVVTPIARDSLAQLVHRFQRELGRTDASAERLRRQLFELLLGASRDQLRSARAVVVVPDRELHLLPFAALRDATTGRYLIEDYTLRTVGSAMLYVDASRVQHTARAADRVLAIGNPKLAPTNSLTLPDLPHAATEARAVAAHLDGSTVLLGADATRARTLDQLDDHSILHFAGHAVFDPQRPELSYLALAADAGDSGFLHAREIARLRPSTLKLVVLSACSTLNPRPTRTGPVAGLAHSFVRAGVPGIVSTLWPVDDAATRELLMSFHQQLAIGRPAAEALQLAQLELLASDHLELRAPKSWAAFVYSGP